MRLGGFIGIHSSRDRCCFRVCHFSGNKSHFPPLVLAVYMHIHIMSGEARHHSSDTFRHSESTAANTSPTYSWGTTPQGISTASRFDGYPEVGMVLIFVKTWLLVHRSCGASYTHNLAMQTKRTKSLGPRSVIISGPCASLGAVEDGHFPLITHGSHVQQFPALPMDDVSVQDHHCTDQHCSSTLTSCVATYIYPSDI